MRTYIRIADIPEDIKIKIVQEWKFSKQNTAPEIAQRLNVTASQVNTIINNHLSPISKKTSL